MKKHIEDEFTDLPMSRQRKYQLRMQRDQRCTECGEPAARGLRHEDAATHSKGVLLSRRGVAD
jgi:hypothetical protein